MNCPASSGSLSCYLAAPLGHSGHRGPSERKEIKLTHYHRVAILDTLQNSVLNSLDFVIQRITDSKADHQKWAIF